MVPAPAPRLSGGTLVRALDAPGAAPAEPAIMRNAARVEGPPDRPLMAVVLVDPGPEDRAGREALTALDLPLAVAADPEAPDSAALGAALRAAGQEVLLAGLDLPQGATPQDVEVSLAARLAALPDAIGLMAREEGGFADDRALTGQVLDILAEDGHGVLLWDAGLNAAYGAAQRAGRPAALVYRRIDSRGARAPEIERRLDRAAFEAARTGAVVVVGTAREETLRALAEWSRGDRAAQVALVPVSAIMRAGVD